MKVLVNKIVPLLDFILMLVQMYVNLVITLAKHVQDPYLLSV